MEGLGMGVQIVFGDTGPGGDGQKKLWSRCWKLGTYKVQGVQHASVVNAMIKELKSKPASDATGATIVLALEFSLYLPRSSPDKSGRENRASKPGRLTRFERSKRTGRERAVLF